MPGWQFWIDRGGTFTDVVARSPAGELRVHKLLSENPERYADASLQGIRDVMGVAPGAAIPSGEIECVRMGTTLATNALLERKGARTVLVTTIGFADALRIGYQNRPNIFALKIQLPEMLYETVVEVDECIDAHGNVLTALDESGARVEMQKAFDSGIRSCAILLMHGYRYTQHEKQLMQLAREIGFKQISASHDVIPLIKFIARGDTTLVDAYLSPVLRDYIDHVSRELSGTRLFFMQSNGGLSEAAHFRGKDSILSGPAGGIVGAVKTALANDEKRIITFDMGGTSTDVAHYAGEYERSNETDIAGVRIRAPMLSIHTVAAGGGSIVNFDGARFLVGPESAGAYPGPACYRRGGPLTVTDCNVMLGRIQPEFFPKVFGPNNDQPLDAAVVRKEFQKLSEQVAATIGKRMSAAEIASGCLAIAIEKMATAIKQVSTQKGRDPSDYTLVCFGGAGGQHACAIANSLGIKRILIHPLAGVLSAFGIGLADVAVIKERSIEVVLNELTVQGTSQTFAELEDGVIRELEQAALAELREQISADTRIEVNRTAHIRYEGTDFSIPVRWGNLLGMAEEFAATHLARYGFTQPNKPLVLERVAVEYLGVTPQTASTTPSVTASTTSATTANVFFAGKLQKIPLRTRADLVAGSSITGPALVVEPTSTIVIEPGWSASIRSDGSLVLDKSADAMKTTPAGARDQAPDPVLLEVFNNLFMFVAEQMGVTLQNTSHSVNIKERLDFSCALFDSDGNLVANAPHIPVHLGSMGESVQQLIKTVGARLKPGDVYALNDPYNGGTHLPDITVIAGHFVGGTNRPQFYVAARGHHAEIGGITPGSMPPLSKTLDDEGVLFNMVKVAEEARLLDDAILDVAKSGKHPSRNPQQNLSDLSAQVASVQRGLLELDKIIARYGLETVHRYMRFVQDNAEEMVRRLISSLSDGAHTSEMDNGAHISLRVLVDKKQRSAVIDFSGSSEQTADNFNAPRSICKAAVLYVFRTLVEQEIPLNAGCMKPLSIVIPERSILNPTYPAAVVAGNVETSQVIVDTLYAALGKLAASQGTMNNFTFGNDQIQYYETICGGSGAGVDFNGTSAVQTHMTNSRLTDPEVLEWRFPVLVREFNIRHGSGGNGRQRGGDGSIRRVQFLKPMTASILSNRRTTSPFGLNGGGDGMPGKNYVRRADGQIEHLSSSAEVKMEAGDVFIIETPGGGGFGAP